MDLDVSDKFFIENYDVSYLFSIDLTGLIGIRYKDDNWRYSITNKIIKTLKNQINNINSLKSNSSKYNIPKSICNNNKYSNPDGIRMIENIRKVENSLSLLFSFRKFYIYFIIFFRRLDCSNTKFLI